MFIKTRASLLVAFLRVSSCQYQKNYHNDERPELTAKRNDKLRNAIVFVGNTGVGKSYLCNRIFEKYGSDDRFATSSNTMSVTRTLQKGTIEYNRQNYTILDSPGFFDTQARDRDGKNVCNLAKALEQCDKIYALVFVFTGKYSEPHKIWFDRMKFMIGEKNQGNILIVQNIQDDKTDEKYLRNKVELERALCADADTNLDYLWITYNPDDEELEDLVFRCTSKWPLTLTKVKIPEVAYEKEEFGEIYEKVVSANKNDEGKYVDEVIDTSHVVTKKKEVDRGFWEKLAFVLPGTCAALGGVAVTFGVGGADFGVATLAGSAMATKLIGEGFTKKTVTYDEFVNSSKVNPRWVTNWVTRITKKKCRDVFKVRFDGTRDLVRTEELETLEEVH